MNKQPRETVKGTAKGIDFASALQNAISKTSGPSGGFDAQHYVVKSHKIEQGGFTLETFTEVTIDVFDGPI